MSRADMDGSLICASSKPQELADLWRIHMDLWRSFPKVQPKGHGPESIFQSQYGKATIMRVSGQVKDTMEALVCQVSRAPEIAERSSSIRKAQCEIMPQWAKGAVLCLPLAKQQADGLKFWHPQAHHILLLVKDMKHLLAAVRRMPKYHNERAKLRFEEYPGKADAGHPRTEQEKVRKHERCRLGAPFRNKSLNSIQWDLQNGVIVLPTASRAFLHYFDICMTKSNNSMPSSRTLPAASSKGTPLSVGACYFIYMDKEWPEAP